MKNSNEDPMSIDVLNSHVEFFDRLINAIPAKFYLADPDDRVDLRSLKRPERVALKAQFKQQHKESKRVTFDPLLSKTTVELLKEKFDHPQQPLSNSKPAETGLKENADASNDNDNEYTNNSNDEISASKESLREKLQTKLQEMRKKRKADQIQKTVKDAKTWRESALSGGREKAQSKAVDKETSLHLTKTQNHVPKPPKTSSLTFTKVEFDGQGDGKDRRGKGKRKPSKRHLLAEAEAHAEVKDGEHQDRHSWGAALKRARGEKVYDDPKLLKKSIKKEAKIKRKKAAAWTEREAKQRETIQSRQTERKSNIQNKIRAKKDAKKARREKKLLRAGFEGRKRGFIASPSPAKP